MTDQDRNGQSSVEIAFDGFLIDMDGTLIDTTEAVVKHWHEVGSEIGIDPQVILKTSHGRRSIDVLRILVPEKAHWEFVQQIEGAIPKNHGHLATEIPGASKFLDALANHDCSWAIVTSSSLPLVKAWLEILKLPVPSHARLITAESVENGKPDPACYCLGCERLGLVSGSAEILVIEDSPAGIKAGKDAKCKVIGLLTSHPYDEIAASEPDWIVRDLRSVQILRKEGRQIIVGIGDLI